MQSQAAMRVLVLADNRLMRAGLRRLIERRRDWAVVGAAGQDSRGIECVRQVQPDVLLMTLEDGTSIACLVRVRAMAATTKILALAQPGQVVLRRRAILLGAGAIFTHDEHPDGLFTVIEKLHAGELWQWRSPRDRLLPAIPQPTLALCDMEMKLNALTPAERQVIAMVASGQKTKEVGKTLRIPEHQVGHLLTSIYRKLEVNDRLELLLFAYQNGLVPPLTGPGVRAYPVGASSSYLHGTGEPAG